MESVNRQLERIVVESSEPSTIFTLLLEDIEMSNQRFLDVQELPPSEGPGLCWESTSTQFLSKKVTMLEAFIDYFLHFQCGDQEGFMFAKSEREGKVEQ
jgi:hypothetical protein